MHGLIEKFEKLASRNVLLAGDFILDRYVHGDVERINPEAPVPVLHVSRRSSSAGGAGNVAAAIPALGGRVDCVGATGDDADGAELCRLLEQAGAKAGGLARLKDRPTTVKTRFVGLAQHRHSQQIIRVDEEINTPLDAASMEKIASAFTTALPKADIVVLEDYNKGVLNDESAPKLIAAAKKAGKCVVVDPALIKDFHRYAGCTVLKPNRYEAGLASGVQITDDASLEQAAHRLIEITQARAVVISLDKEGAYLCLAGGPARRVPHRAPRSVYDVSGAGDETLAVLAYALAGGCDHEEAVELANMAGGLEVERVGFVPISKDEIICEMHRLTGLKEGKIADRRRLVAELARRKHDGQTIVFTNGCFDLIHMGHVRYLRQARDSGDCLVVAINSDASVRRLKGAGRPIIPQDERAEMLAALEWVDFVTVFDEDTPEALLELLKPDVLVKGGTTNSVVGREIVENYGGKVLTTDKVDGLSTTEIINRIADTIPAIVVNPKLLEQAVGKIAKSKKRAAKTDGGRAKK
ncbi:MAG: D-glycero-beta-D-manno-heptose 1-phosphate adenylyltransferase [Planctomycetes bacterium]|nr:D-glycero-beta-D-manno-heptose 1-phosphate adenylyltransferase [Planctomycetota bacterium]